MSMNLYTEYRENSGKPELVLLHGWGMSSQVWGEFAEQLAQYFSLTLIDLPGLGRSQEFPEPYTTDAVVEILSAHAPDKAFWLGWSMGGQIATAFAARYPQRVLKLVMLASNPCFVQREDWQPAMDEETHSQFENSLSANVKKTLNRFIMLQTQGAEQGREILKTLKTLLSGLEHSAPELSLSPLREDVRLLLAALPMPVLQLFGEKDLLVPVSAAEACTQLTGRESIVYAGAGHLPFISHQEQVLDDVLQFLQERVA
ncbi:pimeloyl-ACP methyl ester esterase BioH [Neptuniibacter sp.]|uniref:pimeloyl-ACP methyl ester esterase BioH n=1 Tax=Neptuniibacter sp. TaxID=1962643 RepID=UPI0026244F9F|nr:pimeloyl-ACP methyl ester esterase BioH [Neptuniibacter sp.]MCP4598083.1 pimeloyl-ACP methyl ester esterase BioH [Neptuniibacter sp.]